MKTYTVYMHISPSGKRYVGITCLKPKKRWANGKGYKKNKYFINAINKYGWDNFQHIIVAKGLDEETAKWLEIELIRVWDSTNPNKGYNITFGGDGGNGYKPSDETRKKMSEAKKGKYLGEKHPMYGKYGENNPNYGKTRSEETKKKMSENHSDFKGKNHPQAKSVICITTGRIFDAMAEGAEYYNIHSCDIVNCCKGKLMSAGKLSDGTPLVWMYLEDYEKSTLDEINKKIEDAIKANDMSGKNNPNAKSVICLTTKRIFYTAKEGAEYYNCNYNNISLCCKGKRNYCGKYNGQKLVWKYIAITEL